MVCTNNREVLERYDLCTFQSDVICYISILLCLITFLEGIYTQIN